MKNILVTGALGQIGSELVPELRKKYGIDSVTASDIRKVPGNAAMEGGPFMLLDATSLPDLSAAVKKSHADTIFNLSAILSAAAEANPRAAWDVNMGSLMAALEVARVEHCSLFTPSSIGAFGLSTPKKMTPQDTIQRPATMYGITKVTGELLCDYYHFKYGVDTRGVRYPGIISSEALPGGGTTDYAVEIFYHALQYRKYKCFLKPDTMLDMMFMPDCISAAVMLMEAAPERLLHRNAFNVTAMSFTPSMLAAEIRRHLPDFEITYEPDPVRQSIADSWPDSMDDSAARVEWGWRPLCGLTEMVSTMLHRLSEKLNIKN
jgi:nucleoside-diphosphate-sugar epimerase